MELNPTPTVTVVPGAPDPPDRASDTVCDHAAAEACPVWPGHPITAHWGIPDPAAVEGPDAKIMAAFRDAYEMLKRRTELFIDLPVRTLDRISLQNRLREIGSAAEKIQA